MCASALVLGDTASLNVRAPPRNPRPQMRAPMSVQGPEKRQRIAPRVRVENALNELQTVGGYI